MVIVVASPHFGPSMRFCIGGLFIAADAYSVLVVFVISDFVVLVRMLIAEGAGCIDTGTPVLFAIFAVDFASTPGVLMNVATGGTFGVISEVIVRGEIRFEGV